MQSGTEKKLGHGPSWLYNSISGVSRKPPSDSDQKKFAVKERNENAGTNMEFVKVMVGVKWSVVAATFYMIDIRVKSATDT
ncbi:hypothetical protein ACH5RR_017495 [Cinchona calisaya]|uniref:Uncharacterized protein n=1 Tax=Cinchona calisaya TaxID=153742 RepID=A0ABD2ZIU7_9GENT